MVKGFFLHFVTLKMRAPYGMNTEITWTEKVTTDKREIKMDIIRAIDKEIFYSPAGVGTNHETDQG